jgi:hypothetical protein
VDLAPALRHRLGSGVEGMGGYERQQARVDHTLAT